MGDDTLLYHMIKQSRDITDTDNGRATLQNVTSFTVDQSVYKESVRHKQIDVDVDLASEPRNTAKFKVTSLQARAESGPWEVIE